MHSMLSSCKAAVKFKGQFSSAHVCEVDVMQPQSLLHLHCKGVFQYIVSLHALISAPALSCRRTSLPFRMLMQQHVASCRLETQKTTRGCSLNPCQTLSQCTQVRGMQHQRIFLTGLYFAVSIFVVSVCCRGKRL